MPVERVRARSTITGQVVWIARNALRHFPHFEPLSPEPAAPAGASARTSGKATAPKTPAKKTTAAPSSPATVKKEGQNG